jgi:SAM-dependent methyltransferase
MTDLPYGDGTFDAVVCQFGVMFLPDRARGFAEARRVLVPGGVYIFNTWDRIEVNVFAEEVTRAACAVYPDDPPVFLARTPHGYHDTDRIAADLRAGGFTEFEIETLPATSTAPGPRDPAIAYCQGTPLRNELEARGAERLEEVTDRATEALRARFGDGPVSGLMQAHVVVARA